MPEARLQRCRDAYQHAEEPCVPMPARTVETWTITHAKPTVAWMLKSDLPLDADEPHTAERS